jgi:tetratricopeptide (TPR) repeat protein
VSRVASEPRWGEPAPGPLARVVASLRRLTGSAAPAARSGLRDLPVALRRGALAPEYLAAERSGDHRRAGAASMAAMERAIEAGEWWHADAWAHRALWHVERAELTLHAVRVARRIGDIRSAAGDPGSARRYYAEAIDEARDIGAEREQGRAAVGLGRALMELGDVTTARRMGRAAVELLARSGADEDEVAAASALAGIEKSVGDGRRGEEGE